MIDRSAVLRRTDDHVSAPLEEWLVMMDVDAGKYYLLDDVASFVWTRLASPTSIADLVDELCSHFDVAPSRCEADVLPFLTELHEKGLVQQA
ncbi:MAG: PqqD family peptide modification chaperone [Actinomycetota bacterium]|nr:PqqD family peptide modification chaperone [Actinomycetota bacterium]